MRDDDDLGAWSEFGTAAGLAALHIVEAVPAVQGLGDAPGGWGGESTEAHVGFGAAPDLDGLPPVTAAPLGEAAVEAAGLVDHLDDLPPVGAASLGAAGIEAAGLSDTSRAPAGYHNQVDADGDGHFDHPTYRGDGHGGAEILVDLNGDGRVDFIGHDTDLDNRVDFADYDKDHDGVFEERMYDTDHDGILDRATWLHDS